MSVPGGIDITFLFNGRKDKTSCETLAANVTNSMLAVCPTCQTKAKQCLDSLEPQHRKLLSAEPLDIPSARLPDGVSTYHALNPDTALSACRESEKLTSSRAEADRIVCYPAGTPRLMLQEPAIDEVQAAFLYLAQLIAVLGAGVAIFLLIQLAIRFFSARSPTDADDASLLLVENEAIKLSNVAKRFLDILISIIVLSFLFPVLVLVSLLIFIMEGYPIFYISKRFISLDRYVSILKFRTMVRDAKSPKYRLKERFMRDGYLDIPLDCEVYTPIGRILERTQLVEVLQFFNILFHGMSLIGNRPLPRENIQLLKQFKGWECRFDSPAGITGLSQVVGKFSQSPEERLELECLYSSAYKSKTGNILLCDLHILLNTVRVLLFGKFLSIEKAKRLVMRAIGDSKVVEDTLPS
jgi:lipopolysaccharide/colanic/teichoic acid biosynthesis glycosyltransferase